MTAPRSPRRKLIEVDLPLDGINEASTSSNPLTLQRWWSPKPLAACRAVIFASLVDDPSSCPREFPTEAAQIAERQRLHKLIDRLVVWKNVQPDSQGNVVDEARREIARSLARDREEPAPMDPGAVLAYLREHAPPLHDPFAGGGSIPLEAQRLGLRVIASDLNPVAVLINKALIELPPRFRNQPPVNPEANRLGMTIGKGRKARQVAWRGAAGLADDIRYYGRWMRDEAYKRIGHLYPKARLPDGSEVTVIAWLWARTVPCPNPACGVRMPLMKSFQLSKRKTTKEDNRHWIRPLVDRETKTIDFVVQNHAAGVPPGETVGGKGAVCLACRSAAPLTYVRARAQAGEMGEQMTAIVAERGRKRLFLSPVDSHSQAALDAEPGWRPHGTLPEKARSISVQVYGFTEWHQLFTERQLTALTTLSDLLSMVRSIAINDGADRHYTDALMTYLAFAITRTASSNCSMARWRNDNLSVEGAFSNQAVGMVWNFAETNIFSGSSRNWLLQVERVAKLAESLYIDVNEGNAFLADAATIPCPQDRPIIATDPPYYGSIHYADSSDFFYVWMRRLLRDVYPELFKGILTPKNEEMVANQFRFEKPRQRFEDLLGKALKRIYEQSCYGFPASIFYAYKQQEEIREGRASTGWETMLNAVNQTGFQIVGTWPLRTEIVTRANAIGVNSLASSVALICRPRPPAAPSASRRQFLDELSRNLPPALDQLTREGHIAPTDLAQAAIGPGMQVYSRYRRVETISGERVSVREALAAINQIIDSYEEQQEGELDPKTRFCLRWLRQHGFAEGPFGEAEVLSQASNVVIEDLGSDGLLTASGGKVMLLRLDEYHTDRPRPRGPMTAWEGCHRMAWHLNREAGELVAGAARVVRAMGADAEAAERLARLLYSHYDRAGDSANANIFNTLVTAWPQIREDARRQAEAPSQAALDLHRG